MKNAKLKPILTFVAILVFTAGIEYAMGRLPLGPDGKFGLWEGNIWSSENSQRLLDPYSLTHLVHGILFYGLLWLIARRIPIATRFVLATGLEAIWEILENSPIIINRYRETTISLGYNGDSILNSLSDIVMMATAFILTSRMRPWASILLALGLEAICLLWIRDNLALNILMLIHPVSAIKTWQMIR